MQNVPFVDLAAQQAEVVDEIAPLVDEVLRSGRFIGGPHVAAFEREYAGFVGVRECVGTANGTDALELVLRALGIGEGDEVVLPANTFIATAEAVVLAGATPVFADVSPGSLLLDADSAASVVTERTRAIVPVHLYGQLAPMERYAPLADATGAVLVEDAAQAQGASRDGVMAGAFGVAAGTSFYPGKNLGAAGDAGAVLTDDPALADRVRMIGAHGSRAKYVHERLGRNSRLDAIQAIVLSAKLARLESWNAARRRAAAYYAELLAELPAVDAPRTLDGNIDVHHLYVVQLDDRDRVLAELADAGVEAAIHYPVPLHRTAPFARFHDPAVDLGVAERAADRILSLPMFPHLTRAQQERVVEALARATAR